MRTIIRWLGQAAGMCVIVTVLGCGGGGHESTPIAQIKRTVNIISAGAEPVVGGSRSTRVISGRWVSVPSLQGEAPRDLGPAAFIAPIEKLAGSGTVSLQADGTVSLINDLARDTFKLRLAARHDPLDASDPNRGTTETGVATIQLRPEDVQVKGTDLFFIPADGHVDFTVQAQNGRSVGKRLTLARRSEIRSAGRAYVSLAAEFSVNPATAGRVTRNSDGSYRFTAGSNYGGAVSVTISVSDAFGGPFSQTESGHIVAHPSIVITTPANGASVSGVIVVQYAVANAGSVLYNIDGGPLTQLSTTSFPFNSLLLANGTHTISLEAVGMLENATANVVVGVDNQPDKPGDVSIDSTPISTASAGPGFYATSYFIFRDGGAVSVSEDGKMRFWNPNGSLSNTKVDLDDIVYNFAVDPQERIWIAASNKQLTWVYSRNGTLLQTLSTGIMLNAQYSAVGKVMLLNGPDGLLIVDSDFKIKPVLDEYVVSATSDGKYYFFQAGGSRLKRRLVNAPAGSPSEDIGSSSLLYDLYTPPGYDLLIGTNRDHTIFRSTKAGNTSGYSTLQLPSKQQSMAIGLDLRDPTCRSLTIPANPDPLVYRAKVNSKP